MLWDFLCTSTIILHVNNRLISLQLLKLFYTDVVICSHGNEHVHFIIDIYCIKDSNQILNLYFVTSCKT